MSFEKAQAYLEKKGLKDHIIELEESSATVPLAASVHLESVRESMCIWMRA